MTHIKVGRKVQGIVYYNNSDGLFILGLHRTPDDGGFWQTLTGTVEEDESYQDCLIRELKEETGIGSNEILNIEGPIHEFAWGSNDTLYQEQVYLVEVTTGTIITLSEEHDEYQWITPVKSKEIFKFEGTKAGIDVLYEWQNKI